MLQWASLLETTTALIERAGSWLINSGIQEQSGGVARYYQTDLAKNARISNEITGYAASALRMAHQRLNRAKVLHGLVKAAVFLAGNWDSKLGVFPFETSRDGEEPCRLAYFFDSGIIVRGLLAAWRSTKDRRFLQAAVEGGRSMAANFRGEDGIHPIISLPGKTPVATGTPWSTRPGCYQLKAGLAWRELHGETQEELFRDAWEECLDYALESHECFLPGEPNQEKVMDRLHAYCYFLEGLLAETDRQPCVRILADGIDRVEHFLRQIAPAFERCDVHAQLLRLRHYAAGAITMNQAAETQEAAAVRGFEFDSQDLRLRGAFCFGKKNGQLMPFASPVATVFAMEALTLSEEQPEKSGGLDWRELI
jgi:hypothetical protein